MTSNSLRRAAADRGPLRALSDVIDRRVAAAVRRESRADDVADLRREVEELRTKVQTIEVLFDSSGRGMARMPAQHHLQKLSREMGAVTGDPEAAERSVRVAFRLLIAMEILGVGRIAGGTMNICGKLATVPLLAPKREDGTLEMLEIGTLYGLFAAALLRMTERTGAAPSLTVVDPLVGTQEQPGATMNADASGTPVAEAAVRTNLSLAGAAGLAARVHVGYSNDPVVQEQVSDRSYDVVIVDGDHSYDGVRADLVWAERIAASGALVVLDDFGDPKWPGVQKALEDHLAESSARFTLLGRVGTSGYVRVS